MTSAEERFTLEHARKGINEGWIVIDVDCSGYLEIEKLDDPGSHPLWDGDDNADQIFESDEAAATFVKAAAARGEEHAIAALELIAENNIGKARPKS